MNVVNQLKYYYYKAASTDWVRYIFYMLVMICALILLYIILFRDDEELRVATDRVYKVKEVKKGVAIDDRYFYTISDSHIEKYGRKTGKKILSKKLPFKHLNGGTFVNGDLVVINNPPRNPEHNAIVWIDPKTLGLIDIMPLPQVKGSLTWIDWAWDKWWLCDAHGKNTAIYCFNDDWTLEGYWKLPKEVIKNTKPRSLSGGAWFGEYLCVSGHDKPELYILELAYDKLQATLLKTIPICFDGNGFAFERGKDNTYAWGARGDHHTIVRCPINIDDK